MFDVQERKLRCRRHFSQAPFERNLLFEIGFAGKRIRNLLRPIDHRIGQAGHASDFDAERARRTAGEHTM